MHMHIQHMYKFRLSFWRRLNHTEIINFVVFFLIFSLFLLLLLTVKLNFNKIFACICLYMLLVLFCNKKFRFSFSLGVYIIFLLFSIENKLCIATPDLFEKIELLVLVDFVFFFWIFFFYLNFLLFCHLFFFCSCLFPKKSFHLSHLVFA